MHLGTLQIDSVPDRSKQDRIRAIIDVRSMEFTVTDRLALLRLAEASEETLGLSRITDWRSPEFLTTKCWYMWQTTFVFQPWHGAVEFKCYLHRFMKEFTRIETLAGIKRTVFNQYDSLMRPLQSWLEKPGVRLLNSCVVTALERLRGSPDAP
jgi:oleate hydratase